MPRDALSGIFCQLCAPSAGSRVYYSAATSSRRAECRECRSLARDYILIGVGALLLVWLVAALLSWAHGACLSHGRQSQLSLAWQMFTPQHKLKILVGFCMIATKIHTVCASQLALIEPPRPQPRTLLLSTPAPAPRPPFVVAAVGVARRQRRWHCSKVMKPSLPIRAGYVAPQQSSRNQWPWRWRGLRPPQPAWRGGSGIGGAIAVCIAAQS